MSGSAIRAEAINFDFYADPRNKIDVRQKRGVLQDRQSAQAGQIGIKTSARCRMEPGSTIWKSGLLCVRKIRRLRKGQTYFNIADNDQPAGPYSAADNYSIFNGGPGQGFFEVETIGPAMVQRRTPDRFGDVSSTDLFRAWFDDPSAI